MITTKYKSINATFVGNKTFGNESRVTIQFDLHAGMPIEGCTLTEWITRCEMFLECNVIDPSAWELSYLVGIEK